MSELSSTAQTNSINARPRLSQSTHRDQALDCRGQENLLLIKAGTKSRKSITLNRAVSSISQMAVQDMVGRMEGFRHLQTIHPSFNKNSFNLIIDDESFVIMLELGTPPEFFIARHLSCAWNEVSNSTRENNRNAVLMNRGGVSSLFHVCEGDYSSGERIRNLRNALSKKLVYPGYGVITVETNLPSGLTKIKAYSNY